MDGFEWNKVLMGLILALLVGKLSGKVADVLIDPDIYAENAYTFAEPAEDTPSKKETSTAVLEPIEPLLASADPEAGQKVAKKCLQCHTFEKDGKNRVGPNLWNIIDTPFGEGQGFSYSSAFKAEKEKGTKWDYEALNAFLFKPKAYIKGTKMAFVGLKKAKDRANLIAYLKHLKG